MFIRFAVRVRSLDAHVYMRCVYTPEECKTCRTKLCRQYHTEIIGRIVNGLLILNT